MLGHSGRRRAGGPPQDLVRDARHQRRIVPQQVGQHRHDLTVLDLAGQPAIPQSDRDTLVAPHGRLGVTAGAVAATTIESVVTFDYLAIKNRYTKDGRCSASVHAPLSYGQPNGHVAWAAYVTVRIAGCRPVVRANPASPIVMKGNAMWRQADFAAPRLNGVDSTALAKHEDVRLDTIERALDDVATGRPVIVVDDENRENEGDLIVAAATVTPETMGFMIRFTSGLICVPMHGEDLDRLHLPPMTAMNEDPKRTAYTVSVDARQGVTTGISAADRTRTVRLLADSATVPGQLSRPGHIFPLRAREGGVLVRAGHTEAAVDLMRLAGAGRAAVIAEVVNDDGSMARLAHLAPFAHRHGLCLVSIADLIAYRRRNETSVERVAETSLPTSYGIFRAVGYRGLLDGASHLALVVGDLGDGRDVLVRVHSECLTGDVLASLRCDCGQQLAASMRRVSEEGRGVVLYLRGHEGRGIGLLDKLRAYQLQDEGYDTVDANLELGLPADAREYDSAAHVLANLGVKTVRLISNNPAKQEGLQRYGIEVVDRIGMPAHLTPHNRLYLQTKRDRMRHHLPGIGVSEGAATS